jgi:hypothetical protein
LSRLIVDTWGAFTNITRYGHALAMFYDEASVVCPSAAER